MMTHYQKISLTHGKFIYLITSKLISFSDIVIGNAFKDHPALFLIFEKCIEVVQPTMINDMIRSILVYFIVFWNMKEVINVPTTLTYATQLEETIRMTLLLKPVTLFYISLKQYANLIYRSCLNSS